MQDMDGKVKLLLQSSLYMYEEEHRDIVGER